MVICLDANAYSNLEKKKNPELSKCVDEAEKVLVPLIALGELYAGFECGTKRAENYASLQRFCDLAGVEISIPNIATAERYAFLVKQLRKQGTPIPTNDIWIAATALETGARLVTYDSHFDHVPGLIILNP